MQGKGGADARGGQQLLHVAHDGVVSAGFETWRAQKVDEGVPFVREHGDADGCVAGVGEEGGDVGQNMGRLVIDVEHGVAVVERKGVGRYGQNLDCSKVVETLHPGGCGCGESFEATGGSAWGGVEAGANHVSKVM
jgi:hypothetical protein